MTNFNSEAERTIREIIHTSRNTLRKLLDTHLKDIQHTPERKSLEMKIFYKVLNVITKKWSMQILWELEVNGDMIFNELMRHLEGVSSRSLSDTLKKLEKFKLVSRNVQDTRPPSVLYKLTDKGKGLVELSLLFILQLL